MTSTLQEGLLLEGHTRGAEDLAVAGTLRGSLELEGHLDVHPGGAVEAEARVHSAAVAGRLSGRLAARDCVVLQAGCQVDAELAVSRLIMEPGCRFTGRVVMDVPLPEGL